jgi:hypothetical protein
MTEREQQLDEMLFQAAIGCVVETDEPNVRTDAPPGTLEFMTRGDAEHREFSHADIEDARLNRDFEGWRLELIRAFIEELEKAALMDDIDFKWLLDETQDEGLKRFGERSYHGEDDLSGTSEYAEIEASIQRLLAKARKALNEDPAQ